MTTCPLRNLWSDWPLWLLLVTEFIRPAMWPPWACQFHCIAPFSFTLFSCFGWRLEWKTKSDVLFLKKCKEEMCADTIRILQALQSYNMPHSWVLTGFLEKPEMTKSFPDGLSLPTQGRPQTYICNSLQPSSLPRGKKTHYFKTDCGVSLLSFFFFL